MFPCVGMWWCTYTEFVLAKRCRTFVWRACLGVWETGFNVSCGVCRVEFAFRVEFSFE